MLNINKTLWLVWFMCSNKSSTRVLCIQKFRPLWDFSKRGKGEIRSARWCQKSSIVSHTALPKKILTRKISLNYTLSLLFSRISFHVVVDFLMDGSILLRMFWVSLDFSCNQLKYLGCKLTCSSRFRLRFSCAEVCCCAGESFAGLDF